MLWIISCLLFQTAFATVYVRPPLTHPGKIMTPQDANAARRAGANAWKDGWCDSYDSRENWKESYSGRCLAACKKKTKNGQTPSGCEFSDRYDSCAAFWGTGTTNSGKSGNYKCYLPNGGSAEASVGSRRGHYGEHSGNSAEASVGSRRGHYGEHSETAAVESMKSMLQEERKEAMKAKDMVRLIPIRQALQEINQRETDTRMNLDDAGILSILVKMITERRDSISLYTSAGRVDLADREAKEIQVLQDFVPSGFDSAGETDVGPSKSYKFRKNVVKGIVNGDSGRNWRGEYDFRAAKENQAVVVEPQTYSLAVNFFAVIGFAISAYGAFKHYAGPVHKEHTPLDV